MVEGLLNLHDWLDIVGQGMALETEVKLNTLANGVRKEVASMGGMLYFNWIFVHMLCLINLKTYSLIIFSLVESRDIYKLGSGKTNIKGSDIKTQYRSKIYGLLDLAIALWWVCQY